MQDKNDDVLEWYKKAVEVLDDNDLDTYLRFVLMCGLRKSEAIDSFNLMIRLSEKDKLNDYYSETLQTIQHFKYPDMFFRNTKNVFVSMIPKDKIMQIVQCHQITYEIPFIVYLASSFC